MGEGRLTTWMTKYQDNALRRPIRNVLVRTVAVNPKKIVSIPHMHSRRMTTRAESGRMALSKLMDGRCVDVSTLGKRVVYTMKRKHVGMIQSRNARILQSEKVRTQKEPARMGPQYVFTRGVTNSGGLEPESDPRYLLTVSNKGVNAGCQYN